MTGEQKFIAWGFVIAYVLLNSIGALVIKFKLLQLGQIELTGANRILHQFWTLSASPVVILGIAAIFLSAAAWIVALSRLEISVAYPVAVALNFLLVIIVGISWFGEALTISKGLGISLVVLGILLFYFS